LWFVGAEAVGLAGWKFRAAGQGTTFYALPIPIRDTGSNFIEILSLRKLSIHAILFLIKSREEYAALIRSSPRLGKGARMEAVFSFWKGM
jgi:hypothetical protein